MENLDVMYFAQKDIDAMSRVQRLNLINSITGIKPANLVGTKSKKGVSNLAIISSIVHLSSNPPLIGFIMRPSGEFRRDTFNNIMETGYFTVNHIKSDIVKRAHYTSAKFDKDISEFEACGLTEHYRDDFFAPFVKECSIKIGLKLQEYVPISSSKTTLIVGELQQVLLPDEIIDEKGYLNLEVGKSMGISGLNSYYELIYKESFPYARVNELPKDWAEQ